MTRKTSPKPPPALDQEAARHKCLRLLGLRARSAAELKARLRREAFPEEVIAAVLSDLESASLVNDEEFARTWVASRQAAGGAGRRKLRWELRRKGISEDLIRQVLDAGTDDEAELRLAAQLAQRRLQGQPPEPKTLARLRRLLLGRGFGFDTVEAVLRHIAAEMEH